MNKPESLRGAKAYRYAKNEIENDEDFESIFNHWAFSNAWGLFGLAVNPKTPLRLLKLMLESEYADLVQLVTTNPVFEEMDKKIKRFK
jgi:pentose-5-phosphate-3-epimerase